MPSTFLTCLLGSFILSAVGHSSQANAIPVVLRPCSYVSSGLVAPHQRFVYNTTTSSLQLQDGSEQCLSVSSCAGDEGDLAVLTPCSTQACQAWTLSGSDESPPNAVQFSLSGRCLEVNGAHNPNVIDLWECSSPPDQWKNMEWSYNSSSGAVTSLDTDTSCCLDLCLTPSSVSPYPQNFKIGAYDFFVDESSPVVFNGALVMFESIVRASPQWAGNWIPFFQNCESYFRVRNMHTLAIIVNLTSTCNHAFGAAVVYQDSGGADTMLISGTPWSRANSLKGGNKGARAGWSGPCQDDNNCTVDLFWSSDPTLADSSWTAAIPGVRVPGIGVYNNDITAVPQSAGLPYKWAMALETTAEMARFAVSSNVDPTDVSSWVLLNDSYTVPRLPDVGSCPSLRHDGVSFYYLTGGSNIQMLRSADLLSWVASPTQVLRHADPGDCILAPSWFGAPTGYVPSAIAEGYISTCGPGGNYGDDSDVDLVEWPAPFGSAAAGPAVLLQYGSGNQATFGFANLGLYNGTMVAFLQSFFP